MERRLGRSERVLFDVDRVHPLLEHTVLLTFHHCIGDGFSGVYLMRDLVKALSGAALSPLTDLLAMDELFPPRAHGLRGWWGRVVFILRMLWMLLRYGPAH